MKVHFVTDNGSYSSKEDLLEAIRATVHLPSKDAELVEEEQSSTLEDVDPELQGFAQDLLLQEQVLEKPLTPPGVPSAVKPVKQS